MNVGGAATQTATNPLVTEAFALAITADAQQPAYPGQPKAVIDKDAAKNSARAVDNAIAELRKVAPHGGSYVSESNYFNNSWQEAFWGTNYPKLRAIKAKYDTPTVYFSSITESVPKIGARTDLLN